VELKRYHEWTTIQVGHLLRDLPGQSILQQLQRAVAAILLLVASAQSVAGQSYLTRSYTIDDGLPSPEVFGCAQDRSGRIWFATRLHPIVYDGLTWELPQSSPAELGFTTWISSDEAASIWLVSNRGYPLLSDYDGQAWSSYPIDQDLIPGQVMVTAFAVTSEPDLGTTAAIGTREQGLLLWRERKWQVIGPAQGLPDEPIQDLVGWRGRIYAATGEGLFTITGDSVVASPGDRIPPDLRNLLAVAASSPRSGHASGSDPDLWLLTSQGLHRLDSTGFTTICQGLQLRADRPFHHTIALDLPYSAFVGHQAGFLRVDLEYGEIESLGTGIGTSGIKDLVVDREGNLWAATRRGVSKLVSQRFAGYRSADGLLEDEVSAICEPRPGVMIFGHNLGLTLLDDSQYRSIRFPPATFPDSPNRVNDLQVDRNGQVWIVATELGVGRLDSDSQLSWFSPGKGIRLFAILEEDNGGHLVGGDSLFHFDGRSFQDLDWHGELGLIRRMARRSDGSALIACDKAGLVSLRGRAAEVIPGPDKYELRNAYDIFEDSRKRVWLGTLGGLLVSDGDQLVQPHEHQLQFASPVYFITEDPDGDLWFGTDNGVVRWDGSTARRYTSRDGLVGRETNRDAGFVDSRGSLWIGTESGVSRYQKRLDRPVTVPPMLELLAVEVNGERLDPTDLPELGHRSNSIAFHFRGISFVDEDAVTYRYYLEGFDQGWLEGKEARQRSVRYTNLPPGTYTFHLQASNVNRIPSKLVSSAPIVILEPIWKRWWFLLLASLTVGLVVLASARATIRWRYALSLEKEVVHRRQTEKELVRAYQLKSEFMANMSHEIRTPMNAVIGLTSLLLDTQLTREQRQYVETVNTSASSLLELINEILDFSKIEAGMLELEAVNFDLRALVEETCRALKPKADDKGLELRLSFAPGLPQVLRGDQGRLRQILGNLLENAIKFTVKGWVSLQVALDKENGSEAEIRFVVQDTGIGIPEDKQETVFQAFAQADGSTTRSFRGAGLGLAIAKELCQLSGGRIGLESQEGKGAKLWFTVRLIKPKGEQSELEVKANDNSESRVSSGFNNLNRDVRVLIAEDDLVNQRVIVGTLAKMGFQADVVNNGLEAIRAVGNGSYDVVLMDVQMPEMDGLEAARQIRSPQHAPASRTVPIIAVTAFPVGEYRERCLDAGMDDFLTKPIHPAALAAAISRWVTPSVWASREASRAVQVRQTPEVVFDHGGLLERLGHDQELVQELIEVFFAEVPRQLDSIEAAARDGDIEIVQKLAHKLKGAAGSFGAPALQAVVIEIGRVARGQSPNTYSELVEQARSDLERLRQAVASVDLTREDSGGNLGVEATADSLR
jgi:signal transduction histidine kinase/CheY-like chemotaxis protein/ligand-binding sensor domain-containing protein/HPt (histidine-containing phosphotransfer) domain-containing protein